MTKLEALQAKIGPRRTAIKQKQAYLRLKKMRCEQNLLFEWMQSTRLDWLQLARGEPDVAKNNY